MTLHVIACPQSEAELSVMLCTLEAQGIPAFVQGAGFGSLYPGPQIAFYNARRIMVPRPFAAEARELLELFSRPAVRDDRQPSALNVLRAIIELVLFGWFVPGNRRRHTQDAADAPTSSTDAGTPFGR